MPIFNNKGKTCDTFRTPDWLFSKLHSIFDFQTDVACDSKNKKTYFGFCHDLGMDGLSQDWKGRVFCNPPFSEKSKWMEKAHNEVMNGNCSVCVMILPTNSMETQCWHDFVYGKYHYEILKGRVQFEHEDPAKMVGNNSGTTIVYFFQGRIKISERIERR